SALTTTPTDSANPNPSSENEVKLTVETLANVRPDASSSPRMPPTNASNSDSTRNALNTLRRWKPSARSVPTSTTRLATAAYIVIIARSEEHTSELQSPCNLVC